MQYSMALCPGSFWEDIRSRVDDFGLKVVKAPASASTNQFPMTSTGLANPRYPLSAWRFSSNFICGTSLT